MWLAVRNRTTHLIAIINIVALLLSASAAGQALSESQAAAPSPVELFTGPRAIRIDMAEYPPHELAEGIEGWVELNFMVDTSGKPFEVTVIRSTGNKTFERFATKALERSTFEPGAVNGNPVESGYEMKYQFATPRGARIPAARRDFVTTYESLKEAVKAGDRTAADAAMSNLKITNLYEDAYFGLATYTYATRWGDESQQLAGLRRAIAEENVAHYLRNDVFRFALSACLRLELILHQYAEAMTTWNRLQKAGIDKATAAQLKPAIDQLDKIRSDDSRYAVTGSIADGGWHLHLFKRHFRAAVSEGFISEVKLRCDQRYVSFVFDPKLEYEVHNKDGTCSIEMQGAPGSRFELIQF